jgi:NAD+ kinase
MTSHDISDVRIDHVMIVTKTDTPESIKLADQLREWLQQRQIKVSFDDDTCEALDQPEMALDDEGRRQLGLFIVVGGDGTLLSVAREAVPLGIPVLGVNFGSLGFLIELQPNELFSGLEDVLRGNYSIEERQSMRVKHLRNGNVQHEYALLNDAVITKSALARMIAIDLQIDHEAVATYTSDGLIVSTPTGSTAYSLSAGGPILDPRMSAFVIAPICPHSMTYRPLVVPGSVTVSVSIRDAGEAVFLTLDGQIGYPVGPEDHLEIDCHSEPLRLIRVAGRSFFEVLRRKLRWGAR